MYVLFLHSYLKNLGLFLSISFSSSSSTFLSDAWILDEVSNHKFSSESFWMDPEELKRKYPNIRMWTHIQRKGEMVLVPPCVPHAVLNTV